MHAEGRGKPGGQEYAIFARGKRVPFLQVEGEAHGQLAIGIDPAAQKGLRLLTVGDEADEVDFAGGRLHMGLRLEPRLQVAVVGDAVREGPLFPIVQVPVREDLEMAESVQDALFPQSFEVVGEEAPGQEKGRDPERNDEQGQSRPPGIAEDVAKRDVEEGDHGLSWA